jgi:hypothetical protein
MSFVSFQAMIPHLPAAKEILRERFKFSERVAEELINRTILHFARMDTGVQPKNPRRALLDVVRKFAAARHREEKSRAILDKRR